MRSDHGNVCSGNCTRINLNGDNCRGNGRKYCSVQRRNRREEIAIPRVRELSLLLGEAKMDLRGRVFPLDWQLPHHIGLLRDGRLEPRLCGLIGWIMWTLEISRIYWCTPQ